MMEDVYFAIPSFHRCESQQTLEYLRSFGIQKEKIVIATQTEDDYREYSKRYSEHANIVFGDASSAAGNRNNAIDNLPVGCKIVFLDDDIKNISVANKGKLEPITKREEFLEFIETAFDAAKKNGAEIWGVYPVANEFFMKRSVSVGKILIGTLLGIVNNGHRFNPDWKVKEDYELCCRVISQGGKTIRLNYATVVAMHYTNEGGCHDHWGENEQRAEQLLAKYPYLVKRNTRRKGEIISR